MIIKAMVAAMALTLIPATSMAFGCSDREHQAQSCMAGTVWDADQQTCVKQASS